MSTIDAVTPYSGGVPDPNTQDQVTFDTNTVDLNTWITETQVPQLVTFSNQANALRNFVEDQRTRAQSWAVSLASVVDGVDYSAKEWAVGVTVPTGSAKEWAVGASVSDGSAKEWATKTGTVIDGSEYSAKEYATGSTVPTGSAKEWANEASTLIDGTDYSAKEYAIGTTAPSAKRWANIIGSPVSGGLYSAKEWAVGTTVDSSKSWATVLGTKVDGSEYSAKEYATGSTVPTGSAKEWATATTVVYGGLYSAKHYAEEAHNAATAAAGSIVNLGEWSSLTGPLDPPASIAHNGILWTLTESVADVTTEEPGVSSKYIAIPSGDEVAFVAASQAEMEAATESGLRSMSPANIKQAVDANASRRAFIATGTLVNGDTVALNSDGTVSAVENRDPIVRTPVAFSSDNTYHISCCYDPINNKVVIAYQDVANGRLGTAVVGTVSGTSISFGTPVVFYHGIEETSCCYDSANSKVVIAYRDRNNNNYGTAVVGTVSGTSISFGAPVVFNYASISSISSCYDPINNKVVITCRDTDSSHYGSAVVGTVSGTSISFGSPGIFDNGVEETSCCYDSANSKVVIAYLERSLFAVSGTVSGTSISFGTPTFFVHNLLYNVSCCYDPANRKVVIAYRDSTGDEGRAIVLTVNGSSFLSGEVVTFSDDDVYDVYCCYDPINNKVVITYCDIANNNYGTAVVGTVFGTYISFGTPVVFYSDSMSSISCLSVPINKKVVIAYSDAANNSCGTAVVYEYEYSTSETYLGISEENISNGSTNIALPGAVVSNQSGLLAGFRYYVDKHGNLTDTRDNNYYVGIALSPTEILLEGSV